MSESNVSDDTVELDSSAGRLVLATVVLGSAVASLTATVVNVALPTLARDLDASGERPRPMSHLRMMARGYSRPPERHHIR